MEKDFRKTGLEYNEGFIDGLMWVVESRNKVGIEEILSMVEEILEANEEFINDEERYFNN